jgi:aminopeptidase YwaD
MAILPYVERIAVIDQSARRQVVLRQLEDLGCPFSVRCEDIEGCRVENIVVAFGQGTPRLVVGAHYDSVPGSTGANDDGSGVAILLDLAGTLQNRPLPAPLEVVFFDLEEEGRLGSRAFLRHVHPGDICAMVNLDVCGVGDTILVAPRANLGEGLLESIVLVTLQDGADPVRVMERLPPGDETSFSRAGIPSITVGIAPYEDVELLEAYVVVQQESQQPAGTPSVVGTIHSGPRDSIDAIQETALQAVRRWLLQVVEQYLLYASRHQERIRGVSRREQ